MPFFERLVDEFYRGVATDDVLLPLYPEAPDLTGARHRLTLFLAQYWGGPHTYDHERGHPMLRMRHMPFRIGPSERDHWLANMSAAVAAVCADHVDRDIADELMAYFVKTAEHMRNDTGLPITSATYVER
jgi:hemoglobin